MAECRLDFETMHVRFNPKKADKERTSRDVRFVPKADKRSAAN